MVSGSSHSTQIRLTCFKEVIGVALIALVLALCAAPAWAAVPQCKFRTFPPFFVYPQSAGWQTLLKEHIGVTQARKGYWDDDIDAQEDVLRSPGATPHILFVAAINLASAYWHEGKFGPAISAANAALRTHVDDSVAYAERGLMYFNEHDFTKAISDTTEAITLDPCQKSAYKLRALAYRREHLSQQAHADELTLITIDTEFIEQKPTDKVLYLNRGNDEDDQGAHDKAIIDFSKAISIDPKFVAAFIDRGSAYQSEGRYADDVSDQTKAIKLDPKSAAAWNDLCWGLASAGDLTDALSSCDEAVTLAPRDIDAWDSRGLVDLKMKNYAQAVADYGVVLRIDPEYASSLYGRGLAERYLGDVDASASDIAKAKKNYPGVVAAYARQL